MSCARYRLRATLKECEAHRERENGDPKRDEGCTRVAAVCAGYFPCHAPRELRPALP